ncbi:hypothetical protein LQ564_24085 [Massilia sp. G4R7]|uniref:Uncharacterized protein n=1 Tax=Massilia phyllostachyos TaxID=2898585 RepID=A0ABS8QCA2_9BURK|nr:hypothetical protein [Massilia phyllostachyos]MCD2519387.1 hypothetical protein [Massilia phyllostachyos]
MESIIWALDLVAVAYLCLWALRADKAESGNEKGKPTEARQEANNA